MLTIILTLILSIISDPKSLGTEIEVKGRLIDYGSKKPIADGYIIVKGTTEGTITNKDGEFSFRTSTQSPTLEITTIEYYKLIIENLPQKDCDLRTIEMFEQNIYPLQYEMVGAKKPNKRKDKIFRTEVLPEYRYVFGDKSVPIRLVDNKLIITL